jgi:O-antigen/teichoic acid export membrane protein
MHTNSLREKSRVWTPVQQVFSYVHILITVHIMLREILNTLWTKIASAIVTLCILILTTQYLGADGRGLISLISSSVGIVVIFAGFVGGPAVVYLASKQKLQYLLLPIYGWTVVVAILGSGIVFFFQIVPLPFLLPIAILSIVSSVYATNFYVLVGLQKVRVNNIIYLLQWIVNLMALGFFFILFNKPSVESAVIAIFVSNVFGLALTYYELSQITKFTPFNLAEQIVIMKSLVSFSFFAQVAAVMCYLNYRLGMFALSLFSGFFAVGIYSVGVNLAEFILLASQSIALVGYSRISNTDNQDYARDISVKLVKLGFALTLCITVLLLLLPSAVYGLVFGKDFSSVPGVLLTMSPGIIAFGSSNIFFNYFAGVGKNKINAFAALVGLISNISLCYLLIPQYGLYGAGITASISFIVMTGILTGMFLRETNTRFEELLINKSDIDYFFIKFRELTKKT